MLRIGGEFAAGGAGGFIVGIIGGGIGARLDNSNDCFWGSCLFPGFLIGYPIGAAAGVYLIGNIGNETGSFWATLGGSILGWILALEVIDTSSHDWGLILVAAPIGGIIGFNLTRRHDLPLSETVLINFREGRMSLDVPTVYFQSNSFGRKASIQKIYLAKVDF